MTWDVPVADDCPMCGQTMFKKSGKGFKKPFCINEKCENFTPEEKRGGWKKKSAGDGGEAPAEEPAETKKPAKSALPKPAAKKTAAAPKSGEKKAATAKKPAAKKAAAKKA